MSDDDETEGRRASSGLYFRRLAQVFGAAGTFGAVVGALGSVSRARERAVAETRFQANRGDLLRVHRLMHLQIVRSALIQGLRFGGTATLFSSIELGLSAYRTYWDAWNPLLAGVATGAIIGTPLGGGMGLRYGLFFGGLLAIPVTAIEIAVRTLIKDDALMPSVTLLAEQEWPRQRLSEALIKQIEESTSRDLSWMREGQRWTSWPGETRVEGGDGPI